ncbi:MAG TPA: hypothetical protein VHH88_04005, partial [Verrucomicrobiae bacterium]|nr:hypothetical protein [Verrucomicrobiae bacterium]
TATGGGIYSLNVKTGERVQVYEFPDRRLTSGKNLTLLEWPPDDSVLAYARPMKGKKQQVVFGSPLLGHKVGTFSVKGVIQEFRWVTPTEFLYLNENNRLFLVARDTHGKWIQTREFGDLREQMVSNIRLIAPDEVAWKQGGAIWSLKISGNNFPVKLWSPPEGWLVDFDFSRETGRFLVTLAVPAGSEILSVDQDAKSARVLQKVEKVNITGAAWLNSGGDYGYLYDDHGANALHISSQPSLEDHLFQDGGVLDFKVRGGSMFLYANEENEPPGIWECTLSGDQLRRLTPVSAKPFSFATVARQSSGTLTNDNRIVTYQLWSPPHPKKGAKYGLVLTQTPYDYNPCALVAANAGYCFVSINRRSWEQGIENWESDVLAVYSEMTNRADVDTRRVYLYGHSAETIPISRIVHSHPGLWRGVLLASPTGLPEVETCRLHEIFIDGRGLERGAEARLVSYQDLAARKGIVVTLLIHPNAHHTSWSLNTAEAKVLATAAFLK